MSSGRKKPSPRHWFLLGAVLLLLFAVVLPPLINLGRYQRRIAASISHSIGRPVHMSSVKLRLLPLPGFELSDFLVEEEPDFGSEPILRAESVVANLRLLSLWRGKLEIARIHFDNASLNLVRAPGGSWNFASILVQAAQSPEAPTGQRRPGSTPRFPYIEATNSRINFKEGSEKKPLSFLNADLSVWLENPNEWGIHFRAQPVRTDLDLDLADTGVLRVDGTLRRAAKLGEMPVKLAAKWTEAPLGQLSRLTLGEDLGWRGDLDFEAEISGSAGSARIKSVLKVNRLHRAEFVPAQPLDLDILCNAAYHNVSTSLEDIACTSFAGTGKLLLTGSIRDIQSRLQTELALSLDQVPASAVLSGLREVRDGLGDGLRAVGMLDGHFDYASSDGNPPVLSGEMGAKSLSFIPPGSVRPLTFAPLRFVVANRSVSPGSASSTRLAFAEPMALLLQPVRLTLGAPVPLTLDGRFTLDGFDLHLNGAGALAQLRGLSRAFVWQHGSAAQASSANMTATLGTKGMATLDLDIRGPWLLPVSDPEHPVAAATTVGSVTLRNAELTAPYLSQQLKIVSARGILGLTEITWTDASLDYGPLEAKGTLEYPVRCDPGDMCAGHFQLATPALDLGQIQSALIGGGPSGDFMREILNRVDPRSVVWPRLSGTVETGALSAGKLVLNDAYGDLEIAGNSVKVRSLDGRLSTGILHLTGVVNAAGGRPNYTLSLDATGASPNALAGLFAERWGSGSIDLSAQLKMSGVTAAELAQSATGTLHWGWSKGAFAPQSAQRGTARPLFRFDDWSADATIENSTVRIKQSLLARGAEAIPLVGTITFDRKLSLKSQSGPHAFSVTGTFEHPEVNALTAEAEAHPAQ